MPRFFEIAPREAASMDPQQRLALEVAWETLENAGCAPANLRGTKTGIFFGIASRDYSQLGLQMGAPELLDGHYALGVSHSVASGRISYLLGLEGPSVSLDTACSSSLVAVHLACQSLRTGDSTLALAGGINLMLVPETTALLSRLQMLSPEGRCKAFDAEADGFVRGEGCGMVALKLLSQAQSDGDRILAVIRGTAVNQDGASSSLTAPNGPSQANLIRQALANGGVLPGDVSYIEAHGTGTALGDPIELQALGEVYGAARPADKPLIVASLKTNIGHLEAAAGIAGFIKAVLTVGHAQIPPHLHLQRLTPHVRWKELRLTVPRILTRWDTGKNPRIAAASSFGYSGTNAHVVISEAPATDAVRRETGWPLQILAISAKSKSALEHLVRRYREYLGNHPEIDLRDFCFTANTGRSHFAHRACFLAADAESMQQHLAQFEVPASAVSNETRRMGFLFTGQGSQYGGMGRELYESSPVFREAIERCAAAWKQETGESLMEVLYPAEGAGSRMEQARYAQPALFAFEYALAELWRSWGIEPSVLLGHSLGEYVAAVVAGVFSMEDGLRLVCARARLMDTLTTAGAMRAISAPVERVRAEIAGWEKEVGIGVINGPESVVISGAAEAVNRIAVKLEAEGIRTRALQVTHAFHSPLLEPILEEFEQSARQVKYHAPRIRMISNLTGETARPEEIATPEYWRRHMRSTVQFHAGLLSALSTGCETFVEIGPQPHLITLSKSANNSPNLFWLPSARKGRSAWIDILGAVQTLYQQGAEIDWPALHRKSGHLVALPTYPFERQRYWFPKKTAPEHPSPDWQKNQDASESDSIAQLFYELDWVTVGADSTAAHDIEGTCILFGDDGDFTTSLSAALAKTGAPMATIQPGQVGAEQGQHPCEALLQTVMKQTISPVSDVFYVAPLPGNGPSAQPCLMEFEARMLGECLEITQALLRMDLEKTPRLWIITQGAQGAALSNVAQSTILGFARSLAAEHPELRVVRIDLDPSGSTSGEELLRCLRAAGVEQELVLRGKEMFAPRIRRVPQHGIEDSSIASIKKDGAYLVTGGLSGIGLEVAAWLAERGAAQVIVMGRRAANTEAEQVFRKMRDRGAVVSVCQGDVARDADVQAAIDQARSFALRGVFHCAGVLDDGALLQQNWDRFRRVLAPKLEGAHNLDRLTADLPLDHFVLFSSVASVLGSPGQTNYAAANAFLDAMAHDRRSRGLPALSINWGAWSETGFAVRNHTLERGSKIGLRGISTEDGLHALEMMLSGSSRSGDVCVGRLESIFFYWRCGFDASTLKRSASGLFRREASCSLVGEEAILAAAAGEGRSLYAAGLADAAAPGAGSIHAGPEPCARD